VSEPDFVVNTVCGEHVQAAYLADCCAWCRIEQLTHALARYGYHDRACPMTSTGGQVCNCGYEEAIRP
jgi:hypothetical protein